MTKTAFFKTTLYAALLCISILATAQNKQKWFNQTYGVATSAAYDNAHSLVKYKGTGVQIGLGNESESNKRYLQVANVFSLVPMSGQSSYGASATAFDDRFAVTYLRKLPKFADKKIKIAVGASAYTDVNIRLYRAAVNNNLAWDGNIGLNVVGRAERAFEFKSHSFSVSYTLGLPLISYNHRPNYLGFGPANYIVQDKVENGKDWKSQGRTTTINGKFLMLTQQINLDKIYQNGNRIRLGYNWKYTHNNFDEHLYQGIVSGFSIGILTNLSKKKDPS
jgi:hypothetical protein